MPPAPEPTPASWLRPLRLVAVVALLVLGGVLTLAFVTSGPERNGLGLLPSTATLMARSGVELESPQGIAEISAQEATRLALAGQQGGSAVDQVVLATARGLPGSRLRSSGRLCWVVLLTPNPLALENAPAPGQIELDAILLDARTGGFIEGFIAFSGQTPDSRVGNE
ncbi:MAG: hypothetical protein ACREN4_06490 [Candidatus Dormibacteria bacterium]